MKSMSERVNSEPENSICSVVCASNLFLSRSNLLVHISEASRKIDSKVVVNSPISIGYRILGYKAVTYFYLIENQPNKLFCKTFLHPLSEEAWSWMDICFILIVSILVFLLPEWYLGAIMVSCVLYFAGSIFCRNLMVTLRIKHFVRSMSGCAGAALR